MKNLRVIPTVIAVIALACAAPRSRPTPDRAAASALPEPDPACRVTVARTLALNELEKVTVRVAVGGERTVIELLAPELSPAAAEEIRRAFAGCIWKPAADGTATGTVTFSRR